MPWLIVFVDKRRGGRGRKLPGFVAGISAGKGSVRKRERGGERYCT